MIEIMLGISIALLLATILMANWKRQNISQLDTEYERLGDVVLYCDKGYCWGLDRVGGDKNINGQ